MNGNTIITITSGITFSISILVIGGLIGRHTYESCVLKNDIKEIKNTVKDIKSHILSKDKSN